MAYGDAAAMEQLSRQKAVRNIFLLCPHAAEAPQDSSRIPVDGLSASSTLLAIADKAGSEFALLALKPQPIAMGQDAVGRMAEAASSSGAAMVYADFTSEKGGKPQRHPVIDYQEGSLRDDFDFGPIVLLRTSLLKEWAEEWKAQKRAPLCFGGWYDLRLFLSRHGQLLHLNETPLCRRRDGAGKARRASV